ncbi:hypothetical protein B0H13DRAFT_2267695 [Mycena leptocephala]|nr:hypothetical protein B0H13DRAFT_2267695 [Mycena leptocephala]
MSSPAFTEAEFNANRPPPPLGRGRREIQVTQGRREHGSRPASYGTATPGHPTLPALRNAQPECRPFTSCILRITASNSSSSTLSIPAATPNLNTPGLEKSLPPMPHIPLQLVNVNASANYMDFSLLGRPTPVARPLAPSIPPVASENDLDWFTSLSLSQQAALLSSLKPTAMTTSALYDERSLGGQLEEHFDDQSLGGQGHSTSMALTRRSRSLAADHQKICELAFHYVERDLTHKISFPVAKKRAGRLQTDEFTELLLGSWTNTAFDLELENVEPTAEDIALIRARVPQFRSGIKVMARSFVPGVYRFENILTLPDPTPERIHEAMQRNRKWVETVLKTYHHLDPDQPGPGMMFRNVIIQYILTGYWFGENDADRTFYFKDISRVELATVALILCAVFCAIEEWSTGRKQNKKFSHQNYFDLYQKLVSGLNKWKDHSDKDVREKGALRHVTADLQENFLRNARYFF